jgi:DNA invertase Pin-like site-specific DNA recombinase
MKCGYARVSTEDQNLNLQIDALKKADCEKIFTDKGVNGGQRERVALKKLMASIQKGDEVTVWRLDRLGRSLQHLIEIVSKFGELGVHFRSLNEEINTSSAGGKLVFHIMGALAEFERTLISDRTKAGMASAKSRGQHVGRPRAMSSERIKHAKSLIDAGKSLREVARILKVSPSTLYRHTTAER